MREILFRGKRADSGGWVYGYAREIWASKQEECRYIICPSMSFEEDGWTDRGETEVIPETVGQFTGLTDKNGVKIFEGDILKRVIIAGDGEKYTNNDIVKFSGVCFCTYCISEKNDTGLYLVNWSGHEIEVIGNIHDNPELLK